MKSLIGVYKSYQDAISALYELQKSEYPIKPLTIVGKADMIGTHIHVMSNDHVETAEISVGIVAGAALGLMTGVGIFAIPGFGLLLSAGALLSTFAGMDLGFMAGGVAAIFTKALGVDESNAIKYEKHLNEGNFLLFAPGDKKQVELAKRLLHTQGISLELNTN